MIIRSAVDADLPAVAAAYAWLFEPPGGMPPTWNESGATAALRDVLAAERSDVLVAVDDGDTLAGFCTVYLDIVSVRFGQRCWIEDLAVHPDRRAQRVGARLMDAASDWAKDHGASHVELDSGDARLRAHRFYERREPAWTSRCFGWVL